MLYDPADNGGVVCKLCRHYCKILPERWGICGVRKNSGGKLYTWVFEKAIAAHIDPIEKKPLFHVYPGSSSFSIASIGCNFHCDFCQNSDISQVDKTPDSRQTNSDYRITGDDLPSAKVVGEACKQHCRSISYTYTEPTVFFEYAYQVSQLAVQKNILNVFVTNGYISAEALVMIQPYLHAANVDLKGFDAAFYRHKIGAKLNEVLDSLKLMKQKNIWVEVTTLAVPGYADDEHSLREIARFIHDELGAETPWHISRFFPHYKMPDTPPTPLTVLTRAREIGLEEGLRYVYSGNVPGDNGEHTFCYHCGACLIQRFGFQIVANRLQDGKCPDCHTVIDGIGMSG